MSKGQNELSPIAYAQSEFDHYTMGLYLLMCLGLLNPTSLKNFLISFCLVIYILFTLILDTLNPNVNRASRTSFNKTALLGAIIGCVIMSLPPNQNLLTIIGTRLRFGKPSRLKALAFWWTAGFILFYLFGMFLDINGQFSWALYLIEKGEYKISPLTVFPDAFDAASYRVLAQWIDGIRSVAP